MNVEWWHWIIAGFALIGLDLVIPSFTIIWFGLGALFVGIIAAILPGFPVVAQVFTWIFASICFTLLWFKFVKKDDRKD